jgi:hypothetical protein
MMSLDYENDAVDEITAFLLSPLQEDIYIKIPDGYPTQPGKIGKVLNAKKPLRAKASSISLELRTRQTFANSGVQCYTVRKMCLFRKMEKYCCLYPSVC